MSENILRTVLEVDKAQYASDLDAHYVRPSETAGQKAASSLTNAGRVSLDRMKKTAADTAREFENSTKSAQSFADTYKRAFDDIQKRAESARATVAKISQQKLDGKNFDALGQGAFVAEKRVSELIVRIQRLKADASGVSSPQLFKNYIEDIRQAERELGQLETKTRALRPSGGRVSSSSGGRRRGISQGQAAFLEVIDDFAPVGTNRPFNAVAREALKNESLGLEKLGGIQLATFGAIAAIGAVIVTKTKEVREEAERRLRAEEQIAGAVNRQILSQQQALKDFQKLRAENLDNRLFSRTLQTETADQLKQRQATLEQIINLTPRTLPTIENGKVVQTPNKNYEDLSQRIRELDTRIKIEIPLQNNARAAAASDERFEGFRRNQENARESEKKDVEALKQRLETIKNARTEFNGFLTSITGAGNPYVKIFSEIDTAGERAEKRFASLGKEAVKFAKDAETSNLLKQLNQQRFSTNLETLKLNQDARRVDRLPFFQTSEFNKALTSIERNVQHIADSSDLTRKANEANYYARQYNPNNPKSFDEYRRGGAVQGNVVAVNDSFKRIEGVNRQIFSGFSVASADFSAVGKQLAAAKEEISKLQGLKAGVSGVLGEEKIADRILQILPSTEELLKRLASPYANIRNEAQDALKQQAGAFETKRRAETQRFQNILALGDYNDLRLKDFNEQSELLKKSTGLDKEFAARSAVGIGNELGVGNLDRRGLTELRNAQRELAKILLGKEKDAQKEREAQKRRDEKLDAVINTIGKLLAGKGVPVTFEAPLLDVNFTVDGKKANPSKTGAARPSPDDTARNMGGFSGGGGFTNR